LIDAARTRLSSSFSPKEDEEEEEDEMLELLSSKPWRADKIKSLPIVYRPTKDSWKESSRYRDPDDETVYLYSIPSFKPLQDRTRVDELWNWPWMWSKVKAERLSWLHKLFYADCASMTAQEHIEMDCLLSEFDMPVRWGLLRMKELDVLNVFFLNLAFFTDFTAVKPTDLGLRPDGSVKTCPVQFHNCISSSNRPSDTDHYAPPLRWSRDKSPDQAYDEVKSVYMNYPKRGLKWSSGWIDRGGWHPQQFSGPYFYAQAESLAFHYADDIELVLDVENREVQYRSSTRLGAVDWDVERLRYNQFCRMLNKFGGWYTEPLPRLNYLVRTPYRWTELALDMTARTVTSGLDAVVAAAASIAGGGGGSSSSSASVQEGSALRAWNDLAERLAPYLEAAQERADATRQQLVLEPRVAASLHALDEWRAQLDQGLGAAEEEVKRFADSIEKLLPRLSLGEQEGDNAAEASSSTALSTPAVSEEFAVAASSSVVDPALVSVPAVAEDPRDPLDFVLGEKDRAQGQGPELAESEAGAYRRRSRSFFRPEARPSSLLNDQEVTYRKEQFEALKKRSVKSVW
jgi:uncharacterized protein (DUF1499 family)